MSETVSGTAPAPGDMHTHSETMSGGVEVPDDMHTHSETTSGTETPEADG